MMPDTDALTWRTFAGFCLAATLVAAVTAPIVLWVGPTERWLVLRIAGGLLAAGTLLRLIRAIRAAAALDAPTQLTLMTRPAFDNAVADLAFSRLAVELRGALARRPGARSPLWTRLRDIAARRDGAVQWGPRQGRPDAAELDQLLTRIERAR